jgi:hypothetical protein
LARRFELTGPVRGHGLVPWAWIGGRLVAMLAVGALAGWMVIEAQPASGRRIGALGARCRAAFRWKPG